MMTRSLVPRLVIVSVVLVLGVGLAGAAIDSGTDTVAGTDAAVESGTEANVIADRTVSTTAPDPGETVRVTATIQPDSGGNVTYVDEFDPNFGSTSLVSVTQGGSSVSPSFQIVGSDTVLIVLEGMGTAPIQVVYEVTVPADAASGDTYTFDGTVEEEGATAPVDGDSQLVVGGASPEFEVAIDDVDDAVVAGESVSVAARIENTGDGSGTQPIAFTVNGTEVASETVSLDSDENETVVFEYGTTPADVSAIEVAVASENDTESRTVTVLEQGAFEVGIDDVDDEVTAGENVSVSATVTNTGDTNGTQLIGFAVNGTEIASETVTLDAGESQSLSFVYGTTEDDAPAIEVEVASDDDVTNRTVSVVGDFGVAIDDIDEAVVENETVSVEATITNTGEDGESQSIAFTVNGTEITTESVTLDHDENETLTFEYETTPADVPAIEVAVTSEDDAERRTVTVLEQARFEVTIDDVNASVIAGETVTVEYSVENTGDLEGAQEVTVGVNGTEQNAETVTLEGTGTFTDSFSYATTDEDVPEIEVEVASESDTDARTVPVAPPGSLQVIDVEPAGPVTAGEALDVTVTVENGGETAVTSPVALVIENASGVVIDRIESNATVESGGTETLTMTYVTGPEDAPSVFVRADTGSDSSDRVEVPVQQQSGAASFAVRIDDVDDEVTAGETVTIGYTVENVGDREATKPVTVSVDDDTVATSDVTLGSNETTSLSAEYETTPADVPAVEVAATSENGTATRTVTVLEASGTATFEAGIDDSGTDDSVDAGETASITAVVENTGSAEGTREVRLSIDGVTQDRQSVTLGGGESATLSFSYRTDDGDAPEISFQVVAGGGVTGGTIAVDSGDDGDSTPTESDDSGPGFGVVAMLVSLFGFVLVSRYLSVRFGA